MQVYFALIGVFSWVNFSLITMTIIFYIVVNFPDSILNFKYYIFALTFVFVAASLAYSQFKTPDSLRISGDTIDAGDDRIIEKLIENQTTDVEDSELLDYLTKLEADPLDLNSVAEKDLEKIPFISAFISKNIIQFRKNSKKFTSISELKLINRIRQRTPLVSHA